MEFEGDYDIVIIGSGLGGLACGSILSQRGYKVCVLEQHHQIGGCLQDFKRRGHRFDTGMHYIGSYEDGQILNTLFRYFGIYNKIDVKKLNEEGFDIIQVNGSEFKIPEGVDAFKQCLYQAFPEETEAINSYFDKITDIYDSVDVLNLRDITDFDFGLKKGLEENVYDFVSGLTDNKDLQNIFCYNNSLYAGTKEAASLFIHSVITIFYLQSAFKLEKGGGQIADAFASVITNKGGCLFTNSKVTKIVCEKDSVCGFEVNGQKIIKGKRYISSIDPFITMNLTDGANLRRAYLNRLERLEQTVSCFSLYIILKEKTVKYINSNIYHYNTEDVWGIDSYSEKEWPQGYMFYSSESEKYKGYADSFVVLSVMKYAEMEPWFDTNIQHRGEAYEKMKEQKANQLIDLMEADYPEIRNQIERYYTASPLTYRDYTGVRDGAMYGVFTDSRNPLKSQILPKTRLKNLFLTGQNINMHGILGVSMGAILTCGEMEGINDIIADARKFEVRS